MLYSTGSTHLLSAILTRVAGRLDFWTLARDWLGPIAGFRITGWDRDPQGIYLGGNQMAMSARSLLAFGETLSQRRRAPAGAQIVPEDWIAASLAAAHRLALQRRRLRLWLVHAPDRRARTCAIGWGYGGQMIYVFPATRREPATVIAITSDPDQPSARTGYRAELHRLAGALVQAA